jgi:hypothetical protein
MAQLLLHIFSASNGYHTSFQDNQQHQQQRTDKHRLKPEHVKITDKNVAVLRKSFDELQNNTASSIPQWAVSVKHLQAAQDRKAASALKPVTKLGDPLATLTQLRVYRSAFLPHRFDDYKQILAGLCVRLAPLYRG